MHQLKIHRAYIAASRRSDRSLEARVESARRASEIHKRRTGRSLRVTEQDVINEEMYEEEDDDLPMQYRRLTAHLQTTNADFDRRLAAYLTNHVAMRSAIGQAVSEGYSFSNYTNTPAFANQMNQFPQQNFSNSMLPPQMAGQSSQNFRQSPYVMPSQQNQRFNSHGRAASIASPHELNNKPQTLETSQSPVSVFIKPEDRRLSLPASCMARPTTAPREPSSGSLANLKHEAVQQGLLNNGNFSSPPRQATSPSQQQSTGFPNPFSMSIGANFSGSGSNMPPLSMTLPMESQQLLGPSLDPTDPFTAMLLGKQDYMPQQSFYSYNPNGSSKMRDSNPADGMNQTLAPSMLDSSFSGHGSYSTPVSATDSVVTPQGGFGGYGFENSYSDMFKTSTSGLTTPGEQDWANLIDSNVWEESSSQQASA